MKALQRIGPGLPMKVSWEQIIFTPVQSSDNNNFVLNYAKVILQIYLTEIFLVIILHTVLNSVQMIVLNYGPIAEVFLIKANTLSPYFG